MAGVRARHERCRTAQIAEFRARGKPARIRAMKQFELGLANPSVNSPTPMVYLGRNSWGNRDRSRTCCWRHGGLLDLRRDRESIRVNALARQKLVEETGALTAEEVHALAGLRTPTHAPPRPLGPRPPDLRRRLAWTTYRVPLGTSLPARNDPPGRSPARHGQARGRERR